MFNGYIAISPNFAYDNFQLVKQFNNFNPSNIEEQKYLYLCNANEDIDFSKDWKVGRNKIYKRLKKNDIASKIKYISEDFSKTNDHSTVYPVGVTNGMKDFFKFYHNPDKLIKLYENQHKIGKYDLTPERTNYMAYNFLWSGKPTQALKTILWANKLFPEDLNIYYSMGEIYSKNKDKVNALKSYQMYIQKLEIQKEKMTEEEYTEIKKSVEELIKNINIKK